MRISPNTLELIMTLRDAIQQDGGTVASIAQEIAKLPDFEGSKATAGYRVTPEGDITDDHWWIIMPDGSVLDASDDEPVRCSKKDPRHGRYFPYTGETGIPAEVLKIADHIKATSRVANHKSFSDMVGESLILEVHDYDPEWDYEVDERGHDDEQIMQYVNTAIEEVRREVLPVLGFQDMKVFFTPEGGLDGDVGKYISGTNSLPVVGLDLGRTLDGVNFNEHAFFDQIRATLAHELAHAYQERRYGEDALYHDDLEDDAEAFAYNWVMNGELDPSVLEMQFDEASGASAPSAVARQAPEALPDAMTMDGQEGMVVDEFDDETMPEDMQTGDIIEDGGMMGININDKSAPWTDMILSGDKTIETRNTNSLKPYIGKRVGIVRTGKGPAMLVGYVTIGNPVVYQTAEEFAADYEQHRVPSELTGYEFHGQKFGYPMIDPEPTEPRPLNSRGIVARQVHEGSVMDWDDLIVEDDNDHADALRRTGFWGNAGAGVLFKARDTGRIMFAHRSEAVEQPGTWGTWGGAIDDGEQPMQAAVREAWEESGHRPNRNDIVPMYVFKHHSGFQYFNFLIYTDTEFEPRLNWEAQGYEWVEFGDFPEPLHPGAVSLLNDPKSANLLAEQEGMVVDEFDDEMKPEDLQRIMADFTEDFDDEYDEHYEPEMYQLSAETTVYHGTSAEDWDEAHEEYEPPFWVTENEYDAQFFITWNGQKGQGRIIEFQTKRPLNLILFQSRDDMAEFGYHNGIEMDYPREAAEDICARGWDGWIVPHNYQYGGSDIMICNTGVLQHVNKENHDDEELLLADMTIPEADHPDYMPDGEGSGTDNYDPTYDERSANSNTGWPSP